MTAVTREAAENALRYLIEAAQVVSDPSYDAATLRQFIEQAPAPEPKPDQVHLAAPGGLACFREAQSLAECFHEAYERLAQQFGYMTREETRTFDHQSANGRLMVAVCQELLAAAPPAERDAAPPNAVASSVQPQLGPEAFRFTSFQEWVNKAQSWFRNRIPEPARSRHRYVAIDVTGRVCLIGADFMRARDEETFPVVVYLIDAAMAAPKGGT